ncbi:MAG: hypothetical protein CVU44_11680 [Chloroflexi bacterium HGW-Chloroflexi-6]|nr:MAG: hypothetical protein CVU44_11680 [Chloroflexi bacterium HGW-Chloroflexi-6]
MNQLKRNNHFVPQMYLKNWGDSSNHVWAHRLLVPRNNFRQWEYQPIGGVAYQRDLYTVISNRQEDDTFERWIDAEFETPEQESLSKVINNKQLTNHDWHYLSLFLAAQDVRTPTNYIESTERWTEKLPQLLDSALADTVRVLDEHYHEGKPLLQESSVTQFFGKVVDVTITPNAIPEKDLGEIHAEISIGRKLWIESQRHLLTNTAKVLPTHKWSIAEPAKGMSWFTSDHPVLRLNYYGDGSYDFKGGWDKEGGNLIMPLSPNHLLFTQIGSDFPDRFTFSIDKTYEIQKFLAERADRLIFAHKKLPGVLRLRPRYVNLSQFIDEEEQWKNWHQEQSSAEDK